MCAHLSTHRTEAGDERRQWGEERCKHRKHFHDFCTRVQQWPMFVVQMAAVMQENRVWTSGECLTLLPCLHTIIATGFTDRSFFTGNKNFTWVNSVQQTRFIVSWIYSQVHNSLGNSFFCSWVLLEGFLHVGFFLALLFCCSDIVWTKTAKEMIT